MAFQRRQILLGMGAVGLGSVGLSACSHVIPQDGYAIASPSQDFPEVRFADWSEAEPEYVLYPGDEIEVGLLPPAN